MPRTPTTRARGAALVLALSMGPGVLPCAFGALAGCADGGGGEAPPGDDAGVDAGGEAIPDAGRDAGPRDAGAPDAGPPDETVLALTTPEGDVVHVRDTVTFQVVVEGPNPAQVDLVKDGAVLAELVPPFQYTWDTRPEPEGVHQVFARADTFHGPATTRVVRVVVDRTPPEVAEVFPAENAEDVPIDTAVRVVWDEPVTPESVTALALQGTPSGASAGTDLEPTLLDDGVTLEASLAPLELTPPVFVSVAAGEGLVDRAGNAAVVRRFTFQVPRWRQVGGTLTLDGWVADRLLLPDGTAVIATQESVAVGDGYVDRIQIRRNDGTGWADVGGPINRNPRAPARDPSLAVDSVGRLVVAWLELVSDDRGPRMVPRVARWESSVWATLGPPIDDPVRSPPYTPELAVDDEDRPVVMVPWGPLSDAAVIVYRLVGGAWRLVGDPIRWLDGPRSFARGPDGRMHVLGNDPDPDVLACRWLTYDTAEDAWVETHDPVGESPVRDAERCNVYVSFHPDTGDPWVLRGRDLIYPSTSDGSWLRQSIFPRTEGVVQAVWTADGDAWVLAHSGTSQQLVVLERDGSTWVERGRFFALADAALALDDLDRPMVLLDQYSPTVRLAELHRWNAY